MYMIALLDIVSVGSLSFGNHFCTDYIPEKLDTPPTDGYNFYPSPPPLGLPPRFSEALDPPPSAWISKVKDPPKFNLYVFGRFLKLQRILSLQL